MRRVVITGLGIVSPLGLTVKQTWDAILHGKSGVSPITVFDSSNMDVHISAGIKNFDVSQYLNSKDARRVDVFVQYAYVAAKEAIEDAALQVTEENTHRIGIAIGSGIGGLPTIERTELVLEHEGPRRVSPFFIPSSIINMAPGFVSMKYGIKGPNIAIVSACTTGAHNIGFGARMIQCGDADVIVAGGTEMATSPLGIAGFAAARALSTRNDEPEKASRPWDRDRDGFVLGEGAGVLILEEYEHAKKRGAKIYAELVGFGMSADAYHMTAPDETGSGFVASMLNTLNDAKVSLEQVDYINAHGTSTPVGDRIEAIAIKKAFGAQAYKIPVSSTKSMTGHLLGAAGAVEAIFSILAIRDNVAPPTINLDNPDEDCDLNFVPHDAQQHTINYALSNSFGFGGTNGSLLFKRI
jgi:3-oxoacyl-[acyl-carrier-protein] synthase II